MNLPYKKETIGNQTLYLGDCMDILSTLGKVDAVVTDPPYGISYKSPSGKGRTNRGDYAIIEGDTFPFDPSPFIDFDEVILFGANHYADKLPTSAKWLVWDKRAGMTSNNNSDCELAWCKNGGSARLITHLWNGMLKDSERDQLRVHPTQKPIAVMRWCIEQITSQPQVILDPFMGSGTTLVACQQMGRHGIGIEIDLQYFDIACERVHNAWKQPDMFIDAVSA